MHNSVHMSEVEFLGVEIAIEGNHLNTEIDLGGIYLNCNGRQYCQDVIQSYRNFDGVTTLIECELVTDELELKNIFADEHCNFEMTPTDLFLNTPVGEMYFASEIPESTIQIAIAVRLGSLTKAIDLTIQG